MELVNKVQEVLRRVLLLLKRLLLLQKLLLNQLPQNNFTVKHIVRILYFKIFYSSHLCI